MNVLLRRALGKLPRNIAGHQIGLASWSLQRVVSDKFQEVAEVIARKWMSFHGAIVDRKMNGG
jgi:hypothetical protein